MNAPPPAIETVQLAVTRSGEPVLRELSFSVRPGQVFALFGGNGAGKSTTLLTLLGFVPSSGGSARVAGVDVAKQPSEVRRRVAYLPETAALYPHLTALQNLRYLLALAEQPRDGEAMRGALDRVGLPRHVQETRLETYSKGMRQKVAIALALLRDTPVLMLDEPTSGLDPQAVDEFHKLVAQLAHDGRTVLMVTHDVFGACQVADEIGFLRGGKLAGSLVRPDAGHISPSAVHEAFTATRPSP